MNKSQKFNPLQVVHSFNSWKGMKQRCDSPGHSRYRLYGAKGITYCKKWETFEGFYEDMGSIPKGRSLDRIDNSGNYCKENCRWATKKEQSNNTSQNRIFIYKGEEITLARLSRKTGYPVHIIQGRLGGGWSLDEIFEVPIVKPGQRPKRDCK